MRPWRSGKGRDVAEAVLGVVLLVALIQVAIAITEMLGWEVRVNAKIVAVIITLVVAVLSVGIHAAYRSLRHGRRTPYSARHNRKEGR